MPPKKKSDETVVVPTWIFRALVLGLLGILTWLGQETWRDVQKLKDDVAELRVDLGAVRGASEAAEILKGGKKR